MSLTQSQIQAIQTEGNVVVVAGAGTGKTKTLVERCVSRVCAAVDPISVDQLLVVTFTKAAATEVRKRIRDRLEEELRRNPTAARIIEQIELLEHANISTLHSFCNHLIRQHFYLLNIDPQSKLLDEPEAKVLRTEVMDDFLEKAYRKQDATANDLRQLVLDYFNGDDRPLRELIGKLHNFTETRQDSSKWYEEQTSFYENPRASTWRDQLPVITQRWIDRWSSPALDQPPASPAAGLLRDIFTRFQAGAETYRDGLQELSNCYKNSAIWIRGTIGKYRDPIDSLFVEAEFLLTFYNTSDDQDPLQEDWECVRPHMLALLRAAHTFSQVYADRKKQDGVLDFHDLEQFTIRLLCDEVTLKPTPIADRWRQKFAYICVDEYQDINPAQDQIIQSLGGQATKESRFLVGDVKQSIYGFRQAAPEVFQSYEKLWSEKSTTQRCIYLRENFRSHEAILGVVNGLFSRIMTGDLGGVRYDENHHLKFGNPEQRSHLKYQAKDPRPVEILLWRIEEIQQIDGSDQESDAEPLAGALELADIATTEAEALLVARRFKRLVESRTMIQDPITHQPREVGYGDMAILLRNPSARLEGYATVFHREGIPLQAKRTGFYESVEVMDLLHLLEILDNPRQDIPVIAVLRSPLVGLSLGELAQIKNSGRELCFWLAVKKTAEENPTDPLAIKLGSFLENWRRWRALARHLSISQRLEIILTETHYLQWLNNQDRAGQRCTNVELLMELARAFGRRQGGSLYQFVCFLEHRREMSGDEISPQAIGENGVRLMSIHGSKGLEFPIVAVAGLGGRFNDDDLKKPILLDDGLGLCSIIQLPQTGQRYESLFLWHARHEAKIRARHEEMRLLYVAMTRAQEKLFLVGTATDKKREGWPNENKGLKAMTYLDWIGPWIAANAPELLQSGQGNSEYWSLWSGSETPLRTKIQDDTKSVAKIADNFSVEDRDALRRSLQWTYPQQEATRQSAKTTVSRLRKSSSGIGTDDNSPINESFLVSNKPINGPRNRGDGLTPQQVGEVYHRFLELIRPEPDFSVAVLTRERQRLLSEQVLSSVEADYLDLSCISIFWSGPIGQEILSHWSEVRRELPFTIRVNKIDLAELNIDLPQLPEDDFIIVQGMADLVVIRPLELWIVDFKTDQGAPHQIQTKTQHYTTQLKLYGAALTRIYHRPTTKLLLHFLHQNETRHIATSLEGVHSCETSVAR